MNKHLITCILLVPLVCSCGKQATTSVDTREPLLLNDSLQEIITLDTVRDTPLTNELLLNGRVSFNPERVAHVYPMFGGNVTSVHAEVGDYVGKGDVLAVIRSGEIADIDKQRKEAEHQLGGYPRYGPERYGFRPGLPASPARASRCRCRDQTYSRNVFHL